jgi:hypothetical protein
MKHPSGRVKRLPESGYLSVFLESTMARKTLQDVTFDAWGKQKDVHHP